jgi:flagellar motor component MotA
MKKKAALSDAVVQKLSIKILALLKQQPMSVKQLIEQFKQHKEDDALEVLHWLQEINQIIEKDGLLQINTQTQ